MGNVLPALEVVASQAHVDERLTNALEDNPSTLAPQTVPWEVFLQRLCTALLPSLSVAPEGVERVCLAGAVRAVLPAYEPAWTERQGSLDAFARTVAVLRRHEVTPRTLDSALGFVPDTEPGLKNRLSVLRAILQDLDQRLAHAGLVASASVEGLLAQALTDTHLHPEVVGLPTRVRVWHLLDLPPVRVRFLLGLARWLSAHKGGVVFHVVSEPRRARLPLSLDRALRAFEAEEGLSLELGYGLRDPSAEPSDPWLADWVNAIATGGRVVEPWQVGAVPVSVAEARGPEEEARWVASRVERWLRAGYGVHEVAVVLRRTTDEAVDALGRALDAARIPWQRPGGVALLSSPLARALLGLPRVAARGAPREEVLRALTVLQGNAPRGADPPPWRVAAALRDLQVETLFDTDLADKLTRARGENLPAAVAYVAEGWARDLWSLARDGTAQAHAERLLRWIDRVAGEGRFVEEARSVLATADFDAGAQAILRCLGRDEAGLAAAAELVRAVPSIAARAGLDGPLSAGAFGELLLDLAAARTLGASPGAGAGVAVLDATACVGRSFRALAVVGLQDGGFPARREDEALWGDAERALVARARGAPLEPSRTREAETLLLLAVLASARGEVCASLARHDVGGRARPASPFVADLVRAAGARVLRLGNDPLARSERVPPRGAERELRRYALTPEEAPPRHAEALRSALSRARVEEERLEFFARPGADGGRYTGRIDHDEALLRTLGMEGWAGPKRPVDVTTLERAARCGFKAFAQEVLRLEERPELTETLDDKDRGHLLHKLLEAGQDAARSTQNEPLERRWRAVLAELDAAGSEVSPPNPRVDAHLLRADYHAIRRQVEAWLARRLSHPDGWTMVDTEVAFGPRRRWPSVEVPMPGGEPVVIKGRIDGVERLGDQLRVVEFKSGRGDGFRKRLQDGALDTQFQLPIYVVALALALRAGALPPPAPRAPVDGVYVGFRDLTEHSLRDVLVRARRHGRDLDADHLTEAGVLGQGPLGDAVRRVVGPLRAGRFEPRPRDCDFCQYKSVCRVEAHETPPEESV
ncbi:MAG: PD-(D/E)XK nuclease family protein [Deltaproteobacteria bacterium]|nr:PD-(D/E)XK nuclease family protein [Deltaproteobacteria bacterium]